MKKLIVSLLALSALTGGSLAAYAAAAVTYQAVRINVAWTNTTIWDISGAVQTAGSTTPAIANHTFANTDGSGKIVGGGFIDINYSTNDFSGTTVPLSRLYVDISGKISSTTSKPIPAVTLQLKGNGFTVQDHTTAQTATPLSANLKFTSTTVSSSNITGVLNGTISGNTPLGAKTAKVNNLPVVLIANYFPLFMDWDILEGSNGKATLWSVDDFGSTGTWSGKSPAFTANVKGVAFDKGLALTLTGSTGTYTNGIVGTNTGVSYSAPVQPVTIKTGKVEGQAVAGPSTSVSAILHH